MPSQAEIASQQLAAQKAAPTPTPAPTLSLAAQAAAAMQRPPEVRTAPLEPADPALLVEPAPTREAAHPDAPERENVTVRSGRRGLQDFLAAPAMLAGTLPAAALAGFERLIGTVDTFGEGMLSDEGQVLHRTSLDETRSQAEREAAAIKLAQGGSEYLRPGASMGMDAYEWAGRVAGVTNNPDGTVPLDEEIGGTLLTSAITLPLLPLRALSLGGKVANTAGKAALKAAELMTPLTIVKRGATPAHMATQAALNAAVGIGFDQATRALMDEPTLWNRAPAQMDDAGLPGYGAEAVGLAGATALAGGASLGVAAALRPARARHLIDKANANATPPGTVPSGAADRLGELESTTLGQLLRSAVGAVTDDKAIIKHAIDRVGATSGEDVDNSVRTLVGASMTEQVRRVYEFGDYGAGVKGPAVNGWKQSFARLSPQQQADVDMTIDAGYELRMRQIGVPPSMTHLDDAELQRRVMRGMRDPVIAQGVNAMQDIYRAVSKAEHAKGLISNEELMRRMSGSMQLHSAELRTPQSTVEALAHPVQHMRAFLSGKGVRTDADITPKGGLTKRVRASEILDDFVTRSMREINHNEARALILSTLEGRKQIGGRGNVIVKKRTKGAPREGGTLVSVMENGERVDYIVGDKRLATAIQFRPRQTVPGATAMRRWMQAGTTGNLNPAYAAVSAINDLGANLIGMRVGNQVSGIVDQKMAEAFKKLGMPDNVARGIRSVLAGPVRGAEILPNLYEGMREGIKGRWLDEAAARAHALAAKSGNPLDKQRADRALAAYYETRYARMQESGYAPNAFVVDYENANHAMLEAAKNTTNTIVVKSYKHALEVIREAFRMAAFSRNYAYAEKMLGRPPKDAELRKITGNVRNLGGDITKQSSSQAFNGLVSILPYGNTILQSTTHLVQHMLTNPAAWSVIGTVALMRSIARGTLSPEAREHIDTRVPEYVRNDTLFLENEREPGEAFDPAVHLEAAPLSAELGSATTLASMLFESMATAAGLMEPADQPIGSSSVGQRTLAIMADLVGFSTPPIVNFGLAAFGKGPIDLAAAAEDRALMRQPRVRGSDEGFRGEDLDDGVISDRIANMLNAALGTAGRLIADGGESLFDHDAGALSPEAWRDAMDVTLFNAVEQQAVGQWLTDATKAAPRTTPLANQAYKVDQALEEAARLSRELTMDVDGVDDADLYAGRSFQIMHERLADPLLQQQAYLLHQYMLSPMHQQDMEAIGQLKVRQHAIWGNRDAPVDKRNKALNAINTETQDRFRRVLYNYDKLSEHMRQYDPEWTIERFMKAARADLEG